MDPSEVQVLKGELEVVTPMSILYNDNNIEDMSTANFLNAAYIKHSLENGRLTIMT
jgi:hypothetical protein